MYNCVLTQLVQMCMCYYCCYIKPFSLHYNHLTVFANK
uniref:Uncharacterized protein n=1 Tax=Anguilla anguilla TaxID=7936 RepID=A0A0E9PEK1_ANGAN